MSSTITNYSANIDTTFPIPGADNDTQGFRDNFIAIKNSLETAATEISALEVQAGIGSGDILAGIITATHVYSNLTGDVTGNVFASTITATNVIASVITASNVYSNVTGDVTANQIVCSSNIVGDQTTAILSANNNSLIINGVDSISIVSTINTTTTIINNVGPGNAYNSTLTVESVVGISVGSIFRIGTETTDHIVTGININTNQITTDPYVSSGNTGTIITIFKGRSSIVFYADSEPSSSNGAVGDRKGTIFANTDTLYVCFLDYVNTTTNIWGKISLNSTSW